MTVILGLGGDGTVLYPDYESVYMYLSMLKVTGQHSTHMLSQPYDNRKCHFLKKANKCKFASPNPQSIVTQSVERRPENLYPKQHPAGWINIPEA